MLGQHPVAVLLNANARQFSKRVLDKVKGVVPKKDIFVSRTAAEARDAARAVLEEGYKVVCTGGGDGTLVHFVTTAHEFLADESPGITPDIGVLKLGTGNGWANASGAPSVSRSIEVLLHSIGRRERLPFRRFDLVEIEGLVAHFAGTGWDAELIDDFHAQKTDPSLLPPGMRRGVLGYLNGLVTRAVPRNLKLSRVEVEIHNSGDAALGIDARGLPFEIPNTLPGSNNSLLYRGPVSVCAVGTSNQWGFGFKAFPFARAVPGRFNLRMFVGSTVEALSRVPLLWAGKHPLEKMLTWLLTQCDATFSRQVPFQIGGDLLGHRDRIRYGLAPEKVDVLDFSELCARDTVRQPSLLRLGRGVLEQAVAPALGFSRP